MRFCLGNPLVTKILCGQGFLGWIAHAAAECIAASLSMDRLASHKDVSTPIFIDLVQPLHYHRHD